MLNNKWDGRTGQVPWLLFQFRSLLFPKSDDQPTNNNQGAANNNRQGWQGSKENVVYYLPHNKKGSYIKAHNLAEFNRCQVKEETIPPIIKLHQEAQVQPWQFPYSCTYRSL